MATGESCSISVSEERRIIDGAYIDVCTIYCGLSDDHVGSRKPNTLFC